MRRRDFIFAVGGAVVARPLAARGQQRGTPVVGFLSPLSSDAPAQNIDGFREGLSTTGLVEGTNLAIEYRQSSFGCASLSG
jgi:putative tryptophan/tyrosine transport system substrate-binding protein